MWHDKRSVLVWMRFVLPVWRWRVVGEAVVVVEKEEGNTAAADSVEEDVGNVDAVADTRRPWNWKRLLYDGGHPRSPTVDEGVVGTGRCCRLPSDVHGHGRSHVCLLACWYVLGTRDTLSLSSFSLSLVVTLRAYMDYNI